MKIIITLSLLISSLIAAAYLFVEAVDQSENIIDITPPKLYSFKKSFQENSHYMSAISKRGDISKLQAFKKSVSELEFQLMQLDPNYYQTHDLLKALDAYENTLLKMAKVVENDAPKVHDRYTLVKNQLAFFNKKLHSIGLGELNTAWLSLSKLKNEYVRTPSLALENEFNEQWTYIHVLITELYLDDTMQAPLLEYLDLYKEYFDDLVVIYSHTGRDRVASLKNLTYEIKLQLELLPISG